jgi:hypothetical protein
MSVTQRRAVCFALVATVVFRVPIVRLGNATDPDSASAISPLDIVASQLVLPVEHAANGARQNKAQADVDPGDLVRALLYPGELGRSVLEAYACATDKTKKCTRSQKAAFPEWTAVADVQKLKRIDARLTRAFESKKTTIVAGSFFTCGSAFQALRKGNPGTLGVFSAVSLVWGFFGAGRKNDVAPDVGLLIIAAMTYQSYRIAARAEALRSKRRKEELERVRAEGEAERAKKKK